MSQILKLIVGSPAYGGQVSSHQTKMWIELGFALGTAGDRFAYLGHVNLDTQPIDRARNILVRAARDAGADWLLMIDSDCWVVPSRERGQTDEIVPAGHQLLRMISEADRRGATIVGANVYRRGGEGLMTYKQSPTTGRLLTRGPRPDELGFPALGLEPVDAIGTSVFALNIAKLNLAHEFKFSDVSEDLHLCRSVREFHDDKPGCILVDDRVRTAHMGRPVPLAYDP